MKKSIAKEVRALLALTLDLQAPDFHVFFSYSPHVNKVEIRGYERGWDAYRHPDFVELVYIDEDWQPGTAEERLQGLIDMLKKRHKQFRESQNETAATDVL